MNRDDLPLVAFTLLVQLALGAVALAAMAPLRVPGAAGLVITLLGVAAAALVVASACSLLHLGVKAGALRALRNLRTSWLSREVLFTGLFTALTLAAAAGALARLPVADFLWLVTLTGFAAVFTMSRLYQETIHPAWTTLYTPVSFFAAALTLGAALGAPLVQTSGALAPGAAALLLRDIVLTGAAGVTAGLAATAVYAGDLQEGHLPLAARLLLTLGGLGLLTAGWYGPLPWLTPAGSFLLAAGELFGRVRFFAQGAA